MNDTMNISNKANISNLTDCRLLL